MLLKLHLQCLNARLITNILEHWSQSDLKKKRFNSHENKIEVIKVLFAFHVFSAFDITSPRYYHILQFLHHSWVQDNVSNEAKCKK